MAHASSGGHGQLAQSSTTTKGQEKILSNKKKYCRHMFAEKGFGILEFTRANTNRTVGKFTLSCNLTFVQ